MTGTRMWVLMALCAVNLAFFCVSLNPINLIAACACAAVVFITRK